MFVDIGRASSSPRAAEMLGFWGFRGREMLEGLAHSLRSWKAARQLGAYDYTLFKDIGVSRGNVDWLVRNGRQDGR
ncbi:hypothetical protein RB623_20915 [Mesorhizobium sp. LHD-90]|uniref:hypothetical protein n=1 Tax=Mesorhizobium sp. LHD-90 TaxID=3071414 RepID=UPI0027E0A665|nr:hypothetical protein [Mesorhizobium sp. LHD-90]MDQ6436519.1 hypothetical protein [Mesorhizobium sp. LHD-90]